MPNWTQNNMVITGPTDDLKRFAKKHIKDEVDDKKKKTGNVELDFDTIVPKPEGFDETLTSPPPMEVEILAKTRELPDFEWIPEVIRKEPNLARRTDYTLAYLKTRKWPMDQATVDATLKEIIELAKKYARNVELGNYPTWYEWNIANWGTKWNACHCQPGTISEKHIELRFDTAWDAPRKIYEALQAQWPQLKFTITAEHEGGEDPEVICDDAEDTCVVKSIRAEYIG